MSDTQHEIITDLSDQNALPLAPADVDLVPPLVHSIVSLLRLQGKVLSPAFIMGGRSIKATPAACLRMVRRAGVAGNIVRRDALQNISPLILPCVLLLKNSRSAVLLSVQDDSAQVILPEFDEESVRVSLESLQEDYLGYAIFLTPQGQEERRVSSVKLEREKRWFWDVLWHYGSIYKHVIVASVFINVVGIAGSLFAMNVYDRVVPNNAVETLWVLAVGITLAYGFDFLLRNLRAYYVDMAGRNADVVLSSRLVEKVLSMRFDKKPESTGVLVNNLREFESLRDFFSSGTLLTFVDIPFLLIFLVIIAFIGGPLVLVPLAVVPVMVLGGLWIQHRARRAAESGFKQNMHKNALLVEMVNGLETIKCSMAENRMQQVWEDTVGASALASSQSRSYSTLSSTMASSLTQMVTVVMVVWGVYAISAGDLTMGGLIGCNILVGRAMAPLMQVSSMMNRMQQSRLALKALDLLMETPSENADERMHVDFSNLQPSFVLDNVSFSYPHAQCASLDNVSLRINSGERVGIIGRMGSGKSTLGKLLAGLYEPAQGNVLFGDVDIRQMDTADLRGRMGFLPQDVVLFYGTVRDNIALSDPTVTDRLVQRAADLAGVTDFIRHTATGFGGQVGERGMNFSGGQRQALALARALLHDPDVLILDEPSSNMDNTSESQLRQRIKAILGTKTLILITHRLSMLDLVDRLIVMDNGHIVADGPKDAILHALQHGNDVLPETVSKSVAGEVQS